MRLSCQVCCLATLSVHRSKSNEKKNQSEKRNSMPLCEYGVQCILLADSMLSKWGEIKAKKNAKV